MAYVKRSRQIEAGDQIAELLLLPYFKGKEAPICRTEHFRNTEKKVFWQTLINDEGPKVKLQVNGIDISGLLDTKANNFYCYGKYHGQNQLGVERSY